MLRLIAAAFILLIMDNCRTKPKRNDIILIVSLLCLCLIFFLVMFLIKKDGAYAVVVVNGEETTSYPLDEDMSVTLNNDEHFNVLIIENGEARIESASCPDKLCVKQQPVRYNGETLVCLPNKTTVKIVSEIDPEIDFIS